MSTLFIGQNKIELLTVDSTIHTSDGAPCQFISAENDRFNSIDLENDIVLIPENKAKNAVDFAQNRIIGSYNLETYEVESLVPY